jgi:CHAD domain-containing protein
MAPTAPTALDLAEVLYRRTEHHIAARGAIPRGWHDAVRALGRSAFRLRAHALDAVVVDGALTITLAVPTGSLPDPEARSSQTLARLSGLSLRFEEGELSAPPTFRGDDRARDALGRVSRWCLARIDSLSSDALADRDPEAVHQIRVAVRRLRCALRVVRSTADPPWMLDAVQFARDLGQHAGRVRDLDVSLETLPRLDMAPATRADTAARLRAARVPALESFREAFARDVRGEMRQALDAKLTRIVGVKGTLRRVARAHFTRELAGLSRALGGDLQHAEGFHEIRKRARRVRDAIDLFGRALKGPERRWRKRLQPLQSHLGSLNDVAVMYAAMPGDDDLARAVREVLERRRLTLLAELATPLALLAGELDRR